MPDVRAAERFISDVARLERQAVRAGERTLMGARADLLDVLSRDPQGITAAIRRIGQRLALEHGPIARAAAQAAQEYATLQLAAFDTIAPENGNERPLRAFLDGMPNWQAAAVGRFLAEADRLMAAGQSGDALALALMSTKGDRQSAWQWAIGALALASDAATWQAANGTLMSTYRAAERTRGQRYQKQAIAAIDSRTTNCCLQVHGQIVDLDANFVLNGTPRFAGELPQPPFHYRCRTVITLYTPATEKTGILTSDMRQAARAELSSRTPRRRSS